MFDINVDFCLERSVIEEKDLKKILDKALAKTDRTKLFQIRLNYHCGAKNLVANESMHITFLEITSGNPVVMYSSGYLGARNAKLNFIYEGDLTYEIPRQMNSGSIKKTDNISKFINRKGFEDDLMKILQEVVSGYFKFSNHIGKIWFPRALREEVYVIGGPDFDENGTIETNGSVKSPNADIYSYGDKDTFIDSCIFLSKHISNASLTRCSSNDETIKKNENLVVIGGPGTGARDGNKYCSQLMETMKTQYRYKLERDEFFLVRNDTKYAATFNESTGELKKDIGYFACFKNPYNKKKRVILINGLYTAGVLGAFFAFSDKDGTEANYDVVLKKAIKDQHQRDKLIREEIVEFECLLEVEVFKGRPIVPTVHEDNIHFFDLGPEQPVKKGNKPKVKDERKLSETIEIIQNAISKGGVFHNELQKLLLKLRDGQIASSDVVRIHEAITRNTSIPRDVMIQLKEIVKL